ncbi:MAG: MerR family transcriptional regulator [Cytophagales bacterium]|nr:MerR family transcriptional regulator [Cytophagales bacterium]
MNKKTGMVNKGAGKEYRLINHWDNQEIIPAARDSNKQWRKFSMMDMIWLDMVEDLRQFGCSIEKIRQAKGQLHTRYKNKEAAYPLLALFIFIMISNYNPVCLKIYPDGGLKHLLQRGVSDR